MSLGEHLKMVASADMFYITIDYKACFTLMQQTQM